MFKQKANANHAPQNFFKFFLFCPKNYDKKENLFKLFSNKFFKLWIGGLFFLLSITVLNFFFNKWEKF